MSSVKSHGDSNHPGRAGCTEGACALHTLQKKREVAREDKEEEKGEEKEEEKERKHRKRLTASLSEGSQGLHKMGIIEGHRSAFKVDVQCLGDRPVIREHKSGSLHQARNHRCQACYCRERERERARELARESERARERERERGK